LTRVHICESSTATNRSQKNDTPCPDKNRHDRTPLFPECRSGFSDPISGDLRAFCAQTFAVEFRSRVSRDLIRRWGERILKGNYDLGCGVCNTVKK
jgi:hypothetical protein